MVKSLILDQYGKPIEYDLLDQEIAAPSTVGVRSVIETNSFADLDPGQIARILKNATEGDSRAYFEIAEVIEEKYLHYLGVIGTRKRQVSQLDISVEPASDDANHKKHADLIRTWLKRDLLEGELFDILDAVGKGVSYTEIVWKTGSDLWLPDKLVWRHQTGFEFGHINPDTPMLKNDMGGLDPLPPYKFITHVHPAKSGLAIRSGLARAILWAYLFQNFAIKDWVIFAEVFGMPVRVGKYGPNASAQDKATLMRAVRSIGIDAAAIIPESMMIEFIEAAASGNTAVFKDLCQYLDQQVSKAVLGQTATTDATAGGLGGSQGNVHNDVRADIERADAKLLAVSLNRDLVRPMIDFNFGPQNDGNYPRIKIGRGETLTAEEVDMLTKMVSLGLKVPMSAIYSKLAIDEPKDGEPILGAAISAETDHANPPPNEPAQKRPNLPAGGQSRPDIPKKKDTALLEASYSEIDAILAASETQSSSRGNPDAVDTIIDQIDDGDFGGWEQIAAPMQNAVFELLETSNSLEDFKSNLIAALPKMDTKDFAEMLARAQFFIRAGFETGAIE